MDEKRSSNDDDTVLVLSSILFCLPVAYSLYAHRLSEFSHITEVIRALSIGFDEFVGVLLIVLLIINYLNPKVDLDELKIIFRQHSWQLNAAVCGILIFAVAIPLSCSIIALFGYSCRFLYSDIHGWIFSDSHPAPPIGFLAEATALTLGLCLFVLRLRVRCIYGLVEVGVGVIIANDHGHLLRWDTALTERGLYITFLTAAVYLIVRGLDNIHQGYSKEPVDRVLLWMQRLI
ncbi:MAG: hypothetical protein JSR59_04015 [Proteobacteria bacterium]|nr:hypothetical protein [Pseudomonadota bacterium]